MLKKSLGFLCLALTFSKYKSSGHVTYCKIYYALLEASTDYTRAIGYCRGLYGGHVAMPKTRKSMESLKQLNKIKDHNVLIGARPNLENKNEYNFYWNDGEIVDISLWHIQPNLSTGDVGKQCVTLSLKVIDEQIEEVIGLKPYYCETTTAALCQYCVGDLPHQPMIEPNCLCYKGYLEKKGENEICSRTGCVKAIDSHYCQHFVKCRPEYCAKNYHEELGPTCRNECYCASDADCRLQEGFCMLGCARDGRENTATCTEKSCEQGKFGINCEQSCICNDGSSCARRTGLCNKLIRCSDELWYGQYCNESACSRGLWGRHCSRYCVCEEGYQCNKDSGACYWPERPIGCLWGWSGQSCSNSTCALGTYGDKCEHSCSCNGLPCSKADGRCVNEFVDKRHDCLEVGKWGVQCADNCSDLFCETCDRDDGRICKKCKHGVANDDPSKCLKPDTVKPPVKETLCSVPNCVRCDSETGTWCLVCLGNFTKNKGICEKKDQGEDETAKTRSSSQTIFLALVIVIPAIFLIGPLLAFVCFYDFFKKNAAVRKEMEREQSYDETTRTDSGTEKSFYTDTRVSTEGTSYTETEIY